ncbi:hypothetical protein LDENG_00266810 [Lucifuga dentata]|nr:hypothetical protein LDENG_00266810 [Lucifuga dentata]
MAEISNILKSTLDLEIAENTSSNNIGDKMIQRWLSCSSEKDVASHKESNIMCKVSTLARQSVNDTNSHRTPAESAEQLSPQTANRNSKPKDVVEFKDSSSEHQLNSKRCSMSMSITEDRENTAMSSDDTPEEEHSCQRSLQDPILAATKLDGNREESDAEVVRRAQEEGRVNVVFRGTVTQEGCCRFVSEILKCILYQRQQLPMTYDQLVYSQKKQQTSVQEKETESWRPVKSADMGRRKCQQTLQELEVVLQQLEVLFSLSWVPRVLLLLGGSLVLPKELYEINMEGLVLAGGDQCLRVSSCLRQLFRTLFVADLLSDTRPVRLMPTTVLALAHRDCGVGWFRPKLQFKVPTHVKNQIIALSTDPCTGMEPKAEVSDWEDYVWFQAPMTIKGFSN